MSETKTRYNADELKEFKLLLNGKLEAAKVEYNSYVNQLSGKNTEGGTLNGSLTSMEHGAESEEKETMNRMAARQAKYIKNLEYALIRIENGSYGICSDSGKLISKERLRAVPHTTQSIDSKMKQNA